MPECPDFSKEISDRIIESHNVRGTPVYPILIAEHTDPNVERRQDLSPAAPYLDLSFISNSRKDFCDGLVQFINLLDSNPGETQLDRKFSAILKHVAEIPKNEIDKLVEEKRMEQEDVIRKVRKNIRDTLERVIAKAAG